MEAEEEIQPAATAEVVAQAAEASAFETGEAIERAADLNDDPEVAAALDDAALKADKPAGRVDGAASGTDAHQLLLARRHPVAELLELLVLEHRARLAEHLALFFL